MLKDKTCPVLRATGKLVNREDANCEQCAFCGNCPEDRLSDLIAEIMDDLGKYLEKRLNEK